MPTWYRSIHGLLPGTFKVMEDLPPPVSKSLSRKDYKRYWKKAKERTSSSFSSLHFGHWKVAADDDFLAEIHSLICDIALDSGYSLLRWQSGLTIMIKKKAGVIQVDKLWAILLMEADFNFTNKLIVGSRMVNGAKKH